MTLTFEFGIKIFFTNKLYKLKIINDIYNDEQIKKIREKISDVATHSSSFYGLESSKDDHGTGNNKYFIYK